MTTGLLRVALCGAVLAAAGCTSEDRAGLHSVLGSGGQGELTTQTIVDGLKEALAVGTERAVAEASKPGGYLDNADIRIPLPEPVQKVGDALRKVGLGAQVDLLERKMNEAAQEAAAGAAPVIGDAIRQMTFADAKAILTDGDRAATDYLRRTSYDALVRMYGPVVEKHLESVGVVKLHDDLMARYRAIPFAPQVAFNLQGYTTEKALDGLFTLVGREKQKIRANPAARTTELLRRVFGAQ
jgi:hypothetical protein